MIYWIVLSIVIPMLISIIAFLLYKRFSSNNEKSIMIMFISFGISVIGTGALSLTDIFLNVIYTVGEMPDKIIEPGLGTSNIIVGFICILLGIFSQKYLNDKYYVLNIHGESKIRIRTQKNLKQLGLTDFKVREKEVNFINYFNRGKNIEINNSAIIDDITAQTKEFVHECKEFKRAFAGIGPIPYTVYAGTLASDIVIDDYIDFDKEEKKYKYLDDKVIKDKKLNFKLHAKESKDDEVLLVLSTSARIAIEHLCQFDDMSIYELYLEKTGFNSIVSKHQGRDYVKNISDKITEIQQLNPMLRRINLIMATQPIVSFELGQLFALRANSLPEIVSYHFKQVDDVFYPFGIIVTEHNKGKLIQYKSMLDIN